MLESDGAIAVGKVPAGRVGGLIVAADVQPDRAFDQAVVFDETARIALSSLDPDELSRALVADLHARFGLRSCSIWLRDASGERAVQSAQVGFERSVGPVPIDDSSDVGSAIARSVTITRRDTSEGELPPVTKTVMDTLGPEPKAYLILPLHAAGQETLGALVLVWPEPRTFEPGEISAFEAMAGTLALGFRNARLAEAAARQSALLLGGNRILEAALSTETEGHLGEVGLAVALEVTGAQMGFIGEVSETGELTELAIAGAAAMQRPGPPLHPDPLAAAGAGIYGEVARTGRTAYTNHPGPDLFGGLEPPERHPALSSFMGVPLIEAGRTIGLLCLANRPGGFRDEDGRVAEALAPAIVSALRSRRARDQLARSGQVLAAHLENSPLAVIEFDPQFRVIRWSDEAEKVFGWRADEVLGRQMNEIPWIHADDVSLVDRESEGLSSGMAPRSKNVNRNRRKDGSVIWCEWYDSAIYDATGALTSVLSLVLDVTERRKAEESERQEYQRTRLLLDAAAALSAGTSLSELLDTLCDSVLRAVRHTRVTVCLWDADAEALEVVASVGEPEVPVGLIKPLGELSNPAREALRTRTTMRADFDAIPEGHRGFGDHTTSHLALDVPLVAGETLVGLLRIDDPEGRVEFDEREVALVEGLAFQAAVAIENALTLAYEREQAHLTGELTEIEERLHSSLDPEVLIQQTLADGVAGLGADTGAVSHLAGDTFIVTNSVGFDVTGTVIPKEKESHSVLAIETRQPVVIEDSAIDPRVDHEHMAAYGVGAVIVVPLIVGGEAIGNLYFNFRVPRRFSKMQVRFARRLGSSLSLAIDNARLFDSERAHARVNEALNRLDQSIHSTLSRDEILERVAVESARAIGADGTVLTLKEGDLWVVRYQFDMPHDMVGVGFTVEQAPFMGIAASTEQPVAVEDAYNDPRTVRATQESIGVRAVMMTPLIVRDEVIGGLFFNYRDVHHFTPEDLEYAARLSLAVGLAIVNASLYQTERNIADRLQEALLTLPEELPGLEFAHSYHSATEATRVGGDFYDLFEVDENVVGITIGDVAGKGLDAAVLTSLAKNTIRAHAVEGGKPPAQILRMANEVLFKATPAETFVTVLFATWDRSTGELRYASAAHAPCAVVRSNGTVERLAPTGTLLGAFAYTRFEERTAHLGAGDLLFLYTDGLTEARGTAGCYGEERLFALLATLADRSPGAVVDAVVGDVMEFSMGRLRDDLAILAVERARDS